MSTLTLLLSPEAELDIDEAVEYYDSISQGLGLEFVNVIDKYFRRSSKSLPPQLFNMTRYA